MYCEMYALLHFKVKEKWINKKKIMVKNYFLIFTESETANVFQTVVILKLATRISFLSLNYRERLGFKYTIMTNLLLHWLTEVMVDNLH